MKAKMLEALKQIREQPNPRIGICYQLRSQSCSDENTDYWRSKLQGLFRRWPQFSGSADFPVPHPTEPACIAYNSTQKCGTDVLSTDGHVGICWSFASLNLKRS